MKTKYCCPACGCWFERYASQVSVEHPSCSNHCRSESLIKDRDTYLKRKFRRDNPDAPIQRDNAAYRTPEFREKMRVVGSSNLKNCKGRGYHDRWVELYGEDGAKQREEQRISKLKLRMAGEGNPMFGRPSPNGSGNGWKGWYKGWFFRSLRELTFMVSVIEAECLHWINAETADLAVPYRDYKGTQRTYYADFILDGTRMVEIKPRRLMDTPLIEAKAEGAKVFCEERGLTYELIDPGTLRRDQIQKLVDDGSIVFHDRYKERFEKYDDKR